VFRACFNKFRHCASLEKYVSRVSRRAGNGKDHKQIWGMKNEEFMVDFRRIAERSLDESDYRSSVFIFCWEQTGNSAAAA